MTKVVEAIYTHGVLKPVDPLELPEDQRVRLTIEIIDGKQTVDREAAFAHFLKGVEGMRFRSTGPYPTRDELHDRT